MVKSNAFAVLVAFGVIAIAAIAWPTLSKASPLEYLLQNQGTLTVTATTSPAYMTPGLATTTSTVYDAYANGSASTYATDKAALEIQFTASSSATSQLGWYYEYAQGNATANCVSAPASCDWYADNTTGATTTPWNATVGQSQTWIFASTTQGGGAPTGNRANKIFMVNIPTRYVRAVFYIPTVASTNGAVWAAFVGQKQIPN